MSPLTSLQVPIFPSTFSNFVMTKSLDGKTGKGKTRSSQILSYKTNTFTKLLTKTQPSDTKSE